MVSTEEFKRQTLFEGIAEGQLKELADAIEVMNLKKGDMLFSEGEDTKGIYLIASGKIEISKTTADNWKQTLAVLAPLSFFGELSVMENRKHEASAIAIDDTKLFLLSKSAFQRLEQENTKLALLVTKKIAIALSRNLRSMNKKFLDALINY